MKTHYRLSLSLVLSFLLFAQCMADEKVPSDQLFENDFPVRVGDRARFTLSARQGKARKKVVGIIVSLDSDLVTLSIRDTRKSIQYTSIRKLEIPNGTRRATTRGALLGFASGATIGLIIGLKTCEESFLDPACKVTWPMIGATLGAITGAIVGYSTKLECWERVDLRRLEISVATIRRDNLGLRLTLRF